MAQSIQKPNRPPYGILSVLMIGAFITFLNNTLLNIALPSIMIDLNVNTATVQWLTTGFMLVNGIMIPTTAFLIQKYSVRRLFLVAMGLFTFGTIVAGLAEVFSVLLIARMLQASGSAIMMPLLMNVMLISFPIEKRGTAMGIFGLILMSAPAIGPTLSGWIVQNYDWRMLFYFVTPIAIIVLLIGFFLLKDKKDKVDIRLDLVSLVLSSVGFGGVLYGFSSAGNMGWGSIQVYGTILIGGLSLILFILRQSKLKMPMLNFGVYKYPMFALSSAISMSLNMAMFSGMLLLPIYVQTIRGFSPLDAGLMMLPGAVLMSVMSPVTGKLFDKFGGRSLAITGLTILTISTFYLSQLTLDTTYTFLLVLHAIRMFGISMVMMPVSTNGLNQLPARLYPHGTAMNNTLNQVAGAVGTALLVTVMSTRQEIYTTRLVEDVGGADTQQLMMIAMMEGINDAFLLATILTAVSLILAFFIKRSKQPEEDKVDQSATATTEQKVATNIS